MNKILKKVLTGLVFFIFCNSAWAKNYRIEVIIFQQDSPTSERFFQAQSKINWPNILQQEFRDNAILQKAYYSLQASNNYKPVWYNSWVQNIGSNQTSGAMPVKENQLLDGFVRVQRGHYLHLLVDLEFSPDSSYTDDPLIYRIKQKRRIKLNEIHYFDHPKFGILTTIRPL